MTHVPSFAFHAVPRTVFGDHEVERLADHAGALLGSRVLVVTDPGVRHLAAAAIASLGAMEVEIFDGVGPDPSRAMVEAALERAQALNATGIVGFGGGSPLDVAKVVALLSGSGEDLDEAWEVGKARGPRLPLVLVPTTSGTGSETTPVSIITVGTHEKRGISSSLLVPDLALLDPVLTYDLPAATTAATGIDAMVHAIEAYTSRSPNNNPLSRLMALRALRLLVDHAEAAVEGVRAARAPMMLGANLAGQAFANSPVAAVHALAYPLGGRFKVPHGLSNAVLLPHVLAFNMEVASREYDELAAAIGVHGPEGLIARLNDIAANCGIAPGMRALGVGDDDIDVMADEAMAQTRLLVNNPREVTRSDARAIYAAAL